MREEVPIGMHRCSWKYGSAPPIRDMGIMGRICCWEVGSSVLKSSAILEFDRRSLKGSSHWAEQNGGRAPVAMTRLSSLVRRCTPDRSRFVPSFGTYRRTVPGLANFYKGMHSALHRKFRCIAITLCAKRNRGEGGNVAG